MADHGLTGTHHIDGSLCTRTAACPWSEVAWMAANAALSHQVTAALAKGWCECCERNVLTPYHHDNHNPPYNGYDYCQACYDAGCGDPNDVCNWTSGRPSPGGPMSNNPITPLMLREDWIDHPTLTKSDKAVLDSLPDSQLQQVLDEAVLAYENVWHNMLDEVRGIATDRLLASVPTADSAPEGTQDECLNCALPITRKGDAWIDDIMGAKGCMSNGDTGAHNPRHVLAAYLKALQEGGKAQKANQQPSSTPLLYVLSSDGSSREDGNVHYATYWMFNEPESNRHKIEAALAQLLGGTVENNGVSFQCGVNTQIDDLWDDHDLLVSAIGNLGFNVFEVNAQHITGNE